MADLADRYASVVERINRAASEAGRSSNDVGLVAVSKGHSV